MQAWIRLSATNSPTVLDTTRAIRDGLRRLRNSTVAPQHQRMARSRRTSTVRENARCRKTDALRPRVVFATPIESMWDKSVDNIVPPSSSPSVRGAVRERRRIPSLVPGDGAQRGYAREASDVDETSSSPSRSAVMKLRSPTVCGPRTSSMGGLETVLCGTVLTPVATVPSPLLRGPGDVCAAASLRARRVRPCASLPFPDLRPAGATRPSTTRGIRLQGAAVSANSSGCLAYQSDDDVMEMVGTTGRRRRRRTWAVGTASTAMRSSRFGDVRNAKEPTPEAFCAST